MWSKKQILLHNQAAKNLLEIKDLVFQKAKQGISEYALQQFIIREYKKRKMSTTGKPIVGFNASAATPHYCPKKNSPKLKKRTVVLIDLWARMNVSKAPFADITWMGYYGKLPKKVTEAFAVVLKARDAALQCIRKNIKNLPTGAALQELAHRVIEDEGYGAYLKHKLGHSLGTRSPHGCWRGLRPSNKHRLQRNLGYTIEPGVYLKGEFGIRSEIDFYVAKNKVIITAGMQRKFIKI